jgi:hypothetical protein
MKPGELYHVTAGRLMTTRASHWFATFNGPASWIYAGEHLMLLWTEKHVDPEHAGVWRWVWHVLSRHGITIVSEQGILNSSVELVQNPLASRQK